MPDAKAAPQQADNSWSAAFGALIEGNRAQWRVGLRAVVALTQENAEIHPAQDAGKMPAIWSALAACRGREDVLDCQQRFAQKATEQYTQEITRLAQLTTRWRRKASPRYSAERADHLRAAGLRKRRSGGEGRAVSFGHSSLAEPAARNCL